MCLLQYVMLEMFYMLLNVLDMLYVLVIVCGDRCALYVAQCARYALCVVYVCDARCALYVARYALCARYYM